MRVILQIVRQSVLVSLMTLAGPSILKAAPSCEQLKDVALPHTNITSAVLVVPGAFTPPSGHIAPFQNLPGFCRITAISRPSNDSEIRFELWLPDSGWNGKFLGVGNGGWAGSISYTALAGGLGRGYAVGATDTGHSGAGGSFALRHPEKVVDYAYRSVHELTVFSKGMIAARYDARPRYSYWTGCSAGGRQGLKEAQRYPEDYDGIVAGAPALDWTGRAAQAIWVAQAVHRDEASYIPPAKYPAIHKAMLRSCDLLDGVQDGVLENPRTCRFDPQVLQCKEADGPECLTPPQVESARRIYSDVKNPRTGRKLVPGHEYGSELGWATMGGPRPLATATDHFKYVVFENPDWDYKTYNFDADFARTKKVDGGSIDAVDPDLHAFFARNGKLIQYHGWADPQIAPGSSVDYYNSVVQQMGGRNEVHDSYRLFMVPGMAHCGGGPGPNQFDMLRALEQWVEHGKAPDSVLASRTTNGKVDRTRLLCPYPQIAIYKGSGSTDEAGSFACGSR